MLPLGGQSARMAILILIFAFVGLPVLLSYPVAKYRSRSDRARDAEFISARQKDPAVRYPSEAPEPKWLARTFLWIGAIMFGLPVLLLPLSNDGRASATLICIFLVGLALYSYRKA